MPTKKIINNSKPGDGNISLNHPRDLKTEQEKRAQQAYNADPENAEWVIPDDVLCTLKDRDTIIAALTLMILIDARKLNGRANFSNYPAKLQRAEEILKKIKP